jgi:hypothetical protein
MLMPPFAAALETQTACALPQRRTSSPLQQHDLLIAVAGGLRVRLRHDQRSSRPSVAINVTLDDCSATKVAALLVQIRNWLWARLLNLSRQ